MARSRTLKARSSFRQVLLAGLAGFTLLGFLLGGLTLRLNPRLATDSDDALLLGIYFAIGYGLVGLFFGLVGGLLMLLLDRLPLPDWLPSLLQTLGTAALLLVPLAYFLLLPDVGVGGDLLTQLIFNSSHAIQLGVFALILGLLLALGWLLTQLLAGAAGAFGYRSETLVTALVLLAFVIAVTWSWLGRPAADQTVEIETPAESSLKPAFDSPPLVLLCVDGADFQIIEPMVAAGELPTFARLMTEGSWGRLSTLQPTRSPNIWTSMVTGKTPEEHGIRHFVAFRFPGMRHPIEYFPRHTGLNFQIIPRLESLPGFPPIQAPYTSNLRRAAPIWQIVGQHYPVGAFRWLVTWPVEAINGFNIAASVTADAMPLVNGEGEISSGVGVYYPEDLERELRRTMRDIEWTDHLQIYIGEGESVPEDHSQLQKIRATMNDPTVVILPDLMEKFQPHFLAAGFYSVDSFQHYFSKARKRGGPFADAIAERYRYTDARLGEFFATLAPETQILIVSDHGFDFEHHHHSEAPPGIFIGVGPAFEPGRQLPELSIYDLAPMILHLMGLPLAQDMKGMASKDYQQSLKPAFLQEHRVTEIPSYEFLSPTSGDGTINPREGDIRKELKNLGYIN